MVQHIPCSGADLPFGSKTGLTCRIRFAAQSFSKLRAFTSEAWSQGSHDRGIYAEGWQNWILGMLWPIFVIRQINCCFPAQS